jgi:hypothetical protein
MHPCRFWEVKNSGCKNSTEVKRTFIHISVKPKALHKTSESNQIYVHFIFHLMQSFYISGLWNFLCQKSGLIWRDKRSCFFPTFSVCVVSIKVYIYMSTFRKIFFIEVLSIRFFRMAENKLKSKIFFLAIWEVKLGAGDRLKAAQIHLNGSGVSTNWTHYDAFFKSFLVIKFTYPWTKILLIQPIKSKSHIQLANRLAHPLYCLSGIRNFNGFLLASA